MITTDQNRLWDYRIIEKIGQGEYGIVYKVKHKQTDQVFALKKINISNMSVISHSLSKNRRSRHSDR